MPFKKYKAEMTNTTKPVTRGSLYKHQNHASNNLFGVARAVDTIFSSKRSRSPSSPVCYTNKKLKTHTTIAGDSVQAGPEEPISVETTDVEGDQEEEGEEEEEEEEEDEEEEEEDGKEEDEDEGERKNNPTAELLGDEYTSRPIRLECESQVVERGLLPYFAMGFTTVKTPGAAKLETGLNALRISLHAAQNALRLKGAKEIAEIPIEQWRKWLQSKRYIEFTASYIRLDPLWKNKSKNEIKTKLKSMADPEGELGIEELSCVFSVAKEELGLTFDLGYITGGHWCRWDKRKKQFDRDYLLPARARMALTPLEDPQVGPVLWISNNNIDQKNLDYQQLETKSNQWEALACDTSDPVRYTARRQEIFNYGIGAKLQADISKGVYVLAAQMKAGVNPEKIKSLNQRVGAFLRARQRSKVSEEKDENEHIYAAAPNGHHGWVPRTLLKKVEAIKAAPSKNTDPQNPEKVARKPLLFTEPSGTETKIQRPGKLSKQIKAMYGGHEQPFRIFRAFETFDNATENFVPISSIGGFRVRPGEFLLDTGEGEMRNGVRMFKVKKVSGQTGWVEFKNLQVVEQPWGLGDELPFSAIPPIPLDATLKEYQEMANRRGVAAKSTREAQFRALDEDKASREVTLILHRIVRDLAKKDINSPVGFQKGEIVAATRIDGRVKFLRDFEGMYEVDIDQDDYELFSANAFDVRFSRQAIEEKLPLLPALPHPGT